MATRHLIVLCLLLFVACGHQNPAAPSVAESQRTPAASSGYIALGDSITSGNRPTIEPSWTMALQQHSHPGPSLNAAVGGSTTVDMLHALSPALAQSTAPLVLLFGGTNDFHYNQTPVDTVVANVDAMVAQIQQAHRTAVIIGPLPRDYSHDCCADLETSLLAQYRIALRSEAYARGLVFIDPWDALSDPSNPSRINPAYTLDGIHPNADGSVRLAQIIANGLAWPWQ